MILLTSLGQFVMLWTTLELKRLQKIKIMGLPLPLEENRKFKVRFATIERDLYRQDAQSNCSEKMEQLSGQCYDVQNSAITLI